MNFEDYLLQGKILDALRYRVGVLQRTADKERSNCDGARLVSLGAIAISLPFVAPLPGVGVMAGIAGFSYLGTVWRDFQTSGKLCLLPGSRIGAGDILSIFGLAGEEVSPREQQLMKVMDFLPYEQRVEYAVLVDDEPAIADLLKRLPAQDRLAGYAYMVRRMALGDVKALDLVEVKAAIAAEPVEPTDSVPPTQLQPPSAALPAVEGSATQAEPSDLEEIPARGRPAISAPSTTTELLPAAPRGKSPISYLIGDRLRTSLIVAVSGGGKDYLLANALRFFLPKYPDFKVVAMDCKDDEKEYGYLGDLPAVSVHRLNVAIASDGEVVEWVERCLQEFVGITEKALLICNEGTLIRAKSKRYIDVIDGLVSSGDSREKYAWEAGQSAHADDLGINGAARSRFRPLIIGLKGEEMQVEAILQAKFVADSARNMDDFRAQMMRSPVNRAWSDGQAWYAMPEMENHCGYDRDTRQFLQKLDSVRSLESCLTADVGDEYHPEQFDLNASETDLEVLEKLFDEVIGNAELVNEVATGSKSNELPGGAIAIHEYALRQPDEWVKVRDIQRASLSALKGCVVEQIREFILLLEKHHKGDADDDSPTAYKPVR
ncbi:hypothetical protein H6F95_02185 [Cyanobacteria bacterium FACHB-471]|nr:hypothetical protein [Cyanobacteria bacterium FACHB-471]